MSDEKLPPVEKDPRLNAIQEAQLDTPQGTHGTFELPCGYLDAEGVLHTQVHVREITGHEEDMLASKAVPGWKKISNLIDACLTRVGNIADPERVATVAGELLVGDRVFLMFAIRRTTLGDEYPFRDKCPECGYSGIFSLSLGDLDIKPMKDPRKRLFEVKLPSGLTARFHPLTGNDEEKLSKASNAKEAMSMSILLRLDMLGEKPATLGAVQALGMRDRNALREAFDDHEGGVDTTLDMQCPSCGAEFERDLDVGQAGFFFPSTMRKTSKARSSMP